jgi:uncharacterized membrane protein (UPF0127 family)
VSSLLDESGNVVCRRLAVADTSRARMKGLLGRRSMDADEGLLISPAASVHTAFMRFAIDVVFLDRGMRVLRVEPRVRPWRVTVQRGARAILEMDSGAAERRGISAGMQLQRAEAVPG